MNDVMQCKPPRLEEAEAISAGRVLYGVEADTARSLGSERDEVWMLLLRGQRVAVLKVSNPAESPETLDMQTEAELLAIRLDPALKVAQPRAPLAHLAEGHRARFVARDGRAH
jgi:Ser/Thr protein kinase RdoA (MazF antagonist)